MFARQGRPRPGQVRLAQAQPGRQARHRRGAAGRQGHQGDRRRHAASRRARSASARPRTGCSAPRASWSSSSPGCASWPTASRPASSSASATGTSCWPSARPWLDEQITPDFIVVDGSEGGTGAAPLEYEDHVGTPLTDGLIMMHNALVGTGLRDRIKTRRQRQGGHRHRHRQAADPGRRLHQRRPGDDDGRRLHPGPEVPHQRVPGRGRHPGPAPSPRAGRGRQDRAGHRGTSRPPSPRPSR